MRLRKTNQRRKRCIRKVTEKTGVPFCYILYEEYYLRYEPTALLPNGYIRIGSWHTEVIERKRLFPSYRVLIAHLTRVKLNITEEKPTWTRLRACKIVEGWYTKTGKEIVTKEYELPDERNSMQRRRDERRLLGKRRRHRVSVPQVVDDPGFWSNSWSSGATQVSGTATTMDAGGYVTGAVSTSSWDELPVAAFV